jgi:prepilin-type N-terminal cleavage/methylation domain-containing protein
VKRNTSSGFSLVELATVILLIGIILGFAIPAYSKYAQSVALKSTAGNIAGYMKLAREKAISSQTAVNVHLTPNFVNTDIHIHTAQGVQGFKFPNGITFYTYTTSSWVFQPNGRSTLSGVIAVRNRKGTIDTVSVQTSGMVTSY